MQTIDCSTQTFQGVKPCLKSAISKENVPGTRLQSGTIPRRQWAAPGSSEPAANAGPFVTPFEPPAADPPSTLPAKSLSVPSAPLYAPPNNDVAAGGQQEVDTNGDVLMSPPLVVTTIEADIPIIDLTHSSPPPSGPTPAEELSKAAKSLQTIREMSIDIHLKQQFINQIMEKLECIPPTPPFPPSTETSWSVIARLAQANNIDGEWLHHRMRQWMSYLLQLSSVPLDTLIGAIRATKELLNALGPEFSSKYEQEVENLISNWWMNAVRSETSRDTYKQALYLLLAASEHHELSYEQTDAIEVQWKKAYRSSRTKIPQAAAA